MKIQVTPDPSQRVLQLTTDTDINAETGFTLKFYTDQLSAPIKEYVLTADEITALKAGVALLLMSDIFTTYPSDGYYYVKLFGSSLTSDFSSVAFTLTVRGEVYSQVALVDVYSPDYDISTKLHTCKMLLDEIEQIQNLDFAVQKKVDFDVRLDQLNTIL